MKKREAYDILARYIITLILGIFMWVFYEIFTPITENLVYFALKLVYPGAVLDAELIVLEGYSIKLIPACVAGAAYYLLFILNMATPMAHVTRIKSLIFLWIAFLIMNVARITIFAVLFVNNYVYLSFTHELFWYFGSTILIVCIWFANVWVFKIKKIPVISDMRNVFREATRKPKNKKF